MLARAFSKGITGARGLPHYVAENALQRKNRGPDMPETMKTKASLDGLLVVDYGVTGFPVGIEITAPLAVALERLNQLLADLGQAPLAEEDYKPVQAA